MIDFDSITKTIQVLFINPPLNFSEISESIESQGEFRFIIKNEYFLVSPSKVELENYDLIMVNAFSNQRAEYIHELYSFCNQFSYMPIVAVADDSSEETILSLLSLGIQDVITQTDECAKDRFQIRCKSAIARQLKIRMQKDSDNFFAVVLQYGLEVIFLLSREWDILYVSANVKRHLGYTIHSLVGSNFLNYVHSESRQQLQSEGANNSDMPLDLFKCVTGVCNSSNEYVTAHLTVRYITNQIHGECMVVNCLLQPIGAAESIKEKRV